jgi:two-component system, NarL family, response regulator LiaR
VQCDPQSTAAIRVLIVDEHELVRSSVALALAGRDDVVVVGTAGGVVEALERCGEIDADVVVMDPSMPEVDGPTATALLRQRHPDVEIVLLTGYANDTSLRASVLAGAKACLLKSVGPDELAEAIRAVTEGRSTFSSDLLPRLLQEPGDDMPGGDLTARERDVLGLMASGMTNKGIARQLGLTDGTVRAYVSAILAKLEVTNRTEATVLAIRRGLVDEPPRP